MSVFYLAFLRKVCGETPVCLLMKAPKCDWLAKPSCEEICFMLRSGSSNIICAMFVVSSLISALAVFLEICLLMLLRYLGLMFSLSAKN